MVPTSHLSGKPKPHSMTTLPSRRTSDLDLLPLLCLPMLPACPRLGSLSATAWKVPPRLTVGKKQFPFHGFCWLM